ncbi:acyltransferase family protein [Ornithinimicrobium pekingense]|uniref:Acyltransferase n=1 Tax=Ornithinimicrobium pekingense TaxID=384677 RepID=A0ABQ2F8Z5_9MICO|nr:acyltransferase family protein [Ornithinimicrobium pekingense]GGK73449.1 acyltransferase [Ornithinimicrobium pekingense]
MTAATGTTAPASTPADERPPRRAPLRGDIEGLRAVAVLMVLLYHAGVPGFGGGFAGVDVFFVISGYLITGQLVAEARRSGTVSLTRFYARRARRLLPAASLVLVVTAVAGWWLLPAGRRGELGTDVVGATLYVVNWVLAGREVDYLAEDSAPSLLQHYWSLSVEEQFYVVWPLLILLVLWLCRRLRLSLTAGLTLTLGLVVAASLLWSVVHTAQSPGTAYFVTTTRVWQLGVGGLLVLLTPQLARLRRPAAAGLAWAGLVLIGLTVVLVDPGTPWPGSAALLPTLGTAAVVAAGAAWAHSPPARLLGVGPMRFLGGLSYGLYLWHWPALRLLEETRPDSGLAARLAVAAGSVVLAWATLRLVENPIRFHPALARRTGRGLLYGAASMAATAAVGAAVLQTAPQFDPRQLGDVPPTAGAVGLVDPASRTTDRLQPVPDPERLFTTTGTVYPDPDIAVEDTPRAAYGAGCQVAQGSSEITPDHVCVFGDREGEVSVALVGDSKALQWVSALEPIAVQEGWRVKVYTKSACGFVAVEQEPDCVDYNAALSERLGSAEHVPDLILTSMGRYGGEEMATSLVEHLQPAVDAGARVVMLADNPAPDREELPDGLTSYECVGAHPDDYGACAYESGRGSGTPVLTLASEELGVPLLDLNRWVCPGSGPEPACPSVVGDVLVFRQGSHLTATYVRSLTPVLHHELVGAGAARTPLEQIEWRVAGLGRATSGL